MTVCSCGNGAHSAFTRVAESPSSPVAIARASAAAAVVAARMAPANVRGLMAGPSRRALLARDAACARTSTSTALSPDRPPASPPLPPNRGRFRPPTRCGPPSLGPMLAPAPLATSAVVAAPALAAFLPAASATSMDMAASRRGCGAPRAGLTAAAGARRRNPLPPPPAPPALSSSPPSSSSSSSSSDTTRSTSAGCAAAVVPAAALATGRPDAEAAGGASTSSSSPISS